MKTFEFVAFGPSGRKEFGTIRAWRLAEAKKKIQEMGLYLASIKIQGESMGAEISNNREENRETSFQSKKPWRVIEGLKKFFFSWQKRRNS